MSEIREHVQSFVALIEQGQSLEAIERYYAEDVCVFENRRLARAGRDACLKFERKALAKQPEPPRCKVKGFAVNEVSGVAFIETRLRFYDDGGRPLRLEEVAVQRWESGHIIEERFYYEGVVDEGDLEDDM